MYSAFAKRVCNHFHEAQGCCSSPEAHEICGVKKTFIHGPLPGLPLSPLLPAFLNDPPPHTNPQRPTRDHAPSESYCVVDNLMTTAVHVMYRCVICQGVTSRCRIPPASSAQWNEGSRSVTWSTLKKKVVSMRAHVLYSSNK